MKSSVAFAPTPSALPIRPRSADLRAAETERASVARIENVAAVQDMLFTPAVTRRQLQGAFELVYRAYRHAGLTPPNAYGMRITPYQLLPTTDIFVAVRGDEVVGTISLVCDGALGLPMEAIYGEEIRWLRNTGLHLAEVSCLADRRQDGQSPATATQLMSLMAQCAQRRGVDQLLIAVHPKHARFYQRFTAFEPIGGLKSYHAVCDRPAVALALDLKRVPLDHPLIYNRFFGKPFPEEALQRHLLSELLRKEFEPIVAASYDADAYAELAMAG